MDFREIRSHKKLYLGIIVYALIIGTLLWIVNLDAVNKWLGGVLLLLRPVLIGLALAYLCDPVFRFFERRVFFRLHPQGLRRTLSLLCTYLFVFLILALILLLIIPQLLQSIAAFASDYQMYVDGAVDQLNRWIGAVNSLASHITGSDQLIKPIERNQLQGGLATWWNANRDRLLEQLTKIDIKPIADVIGGAVSVVTDSLFGIFISLYLLSTKEKRYAQVMKLRRALFGNSVNQRITDFCRIADRSFGAFIEGKLFDSLILGILAYFIFLILQIPYAILFAAIVGITNIVPIIGPIVGAVPAAFLLLLTAPAKVIPFILAIIILQQIDGNIIGPKILGSNTGVSSLCVVIAISTMGNWFGLLGMLLGVPLFATVLALSDRAITDRLQKRGLPSGVENYYVAGSHSGAVKSAGSTTDNTVQRLELAALHIDQKLLHKEPLTRKERFLMFVYNKAHKYRIISESSDVSRARFAAANAVQLAQRAADAAWTATKEAAETEPREASDLPAPTPEADEEKGE